MSAKESRGCGLYFVTTFSLSGDHTLPSEYETQSLLGHLHLFNPSHVERSESNSFSRKPEEGKGFSLQAINANETDEDSPPTESLRSIKSIAEERKKKILAKTQSLQENLKQVSKELVRGAAKTKSEHKKSMEIFFGSFQLADLIQNFKSVVVFRIATSP